MKIVYIYCEGQTEESFVNEVLYPYFTNMDIYVKPIVHKTKRTPTKSFKGGVSEYKTIKNEIIKLCNNSNVFVTTMFDYYGMAKDTPAIDYNIPNIYERMEYIEKEITKDVDRRNFEFNFLLHEFEGLLFSDTQAFDVIADNRSVGVMLISFKTPGCQRAAAGESEGHSVLLQTKVNKLWFVMT